METRDMVLNDVKYHDILGYAMKNKIEADPILEQRIEQFRDEKKDETNPIKQVLFKESTKNNEEFHALGELLKIINYYKTNEKKIVLIVSTDVQELVKQFFKGEDTCFINFACYQEPLKVFDKLLSPLSYYTLVSPHINKRYHNDFIENLDELWFAGMLKNLDSSVFVSEIEYQDIIDYAENFNSMTFAKVRNEYLKDERPKHQKALIEATNTGFLTIQEDIVSQLELIL